MEKEPFKKIINKVKTINPILTKTATQPLITHAISKLGHSMGKGSLG